MTRRIVIKPAIRVAGAGPAARNVSIRSGETGTSEILICVVPSTTVTLCSAVTYPSFTMVSVWFPDCYVGERDRRYTLINSIEQDPGPCGTCCYVKRTG
jgi:hypothetical protein